MRIRPDILILDKKGASLATVDVKNIPNLSPSAAIDLRDAFAQRLGRPAKYLLILSQESGFIWEMDRAGNFSDEDGERMSMGPVLREYLTEAELARWVRGAELELVFSHWLGDQARGHIIRPAGVSDHGLFNRFLTDIRGAQILLETAA